MTTNVHHDVTMKRRQVTIRLLEKRDQAAAVDMIWRLIYLQTMTYGVANAVTKKRMLFVYMVCALFGYFDQYLLSQAFLYFVTPPCCVYVAYRYILLPVVYYTSQGNSKDLYAFWSQNDIGRCMWVAEVDGTVVGTAALERLSATTAEVFRVCVRKDYRGLGIAKKLMATLLQHCESRGFDHVVLLTSYIQVPAQILYENMGFDRVNILTITVLPYFLQFEKFMYHYSQKGVPPGVWASKDGADLIYE